MLETFTQGFGVFLIALLGGLAGAVAKHLFSFFGRRTDQKTKTRDTLETLIIDTLEEVRGLAIQYWSKDENDGLKASSARIVALCDSVPDLYLRLFDNDTTVTRELDVIMNRLSGVVTGGTFQQSDRKADHSVISEMERHNMALTVAVRIQKAELPYPWF